MHSHCTCGEDGDSGDDEVEFDHPDYRYTTAQGMIKEMTAAAAGAKSLGDMQQKLLEQMHAGKISLPPVSTASSADGYESFENTSNKKKRKIPLSSASSMHQSQLSAEMASMGISQGDGLLDEPVGGPVAVQHQQYSPASAASGSGTGISGAGRGRYGRQTARTDRRPLSTMNTVNGYTARVPSKAGLDVLSAQGESHPYRECWWIRFADYRCFSVQTLASKTRAASSRKPSEPPPNKVL